MLANINHRAHHAVPEIQAIRRSPPSHTFNSDPRMNPMLLDHPRGSPKSTQSHTAVKKEEPRSPQPSSLASDNPRPPKR